MRKFRIASRFSGFDLLLIPLIFVLLGLARLAVLVLPLGTYVGVLGQPTGLETLPADVDDHATDLAHRQGRLVRAVARNTPWRSLCLPQALTVAVLLRASQLPFVAYFGLTKSKDTESFDALLAHAWVMVGAVPVTGGKGHEHHAVVGAYAYRNSGT